MYVMQGGIDAIVTPAEIMAHACHNRNLSQVSCYDHLMYIIELCGFCNTVLPAYVIQ